MLRFAPYLVFAYVLAGLLAGTSEAPIVLGRYSYQAAALIALCLVPYLAAALARRRHPTRSTAMVLSPLEPLAFVTLVVLSFVVTGSNAVQRLPFVQYVLPAVRVLAAVALMTRESARARHAGAPYGPLLAAATMLLVWASGDLLVAVVTRDVPPHAQASALAFREPIDLRQLQDDAIVLVGDSFVWGQGVAAGETFGAQVERHLREQGRTASVHGLGVIGAGLRTYLDVVEALPREHRVDRVALVFYMNDMPAAPRLVDAFRNQMITLGVGSPTLRIVGDLAARRLTPTLDAYHAQIVRDYDPTDPTFSARWDTLRRQLTTFFAGASTRSRNTPVLVVLPLMVEFSTYPLDDAHGRLGELGRAIGYEVVDLLPVFRDELGDGRSHRLAADDNHFDAATHGVVARALASSLSRP